MDDCNYLFVCFCNKMIEKWKETFNSATTLLFFLVLEKPPNVTMMLIFSYLSVIL